MKSSDKGETWQNMGLTDSHHIGKIEINPNNPNELMVGVTGHLYSKNTERGIYKSTDGGNSWKQTLYIDDETGIIDISVSPKNFNIQYAAAWKKDRKAWNFSGLAIISFCWSQSRATFDSSCSILIKSGKFLA